MGRNTSVTKRDVEYIHLAYQKLSRDGKKPRAVDVQMEASNLAHREFGLSTVQRVLAPLRKAEIDWVGKVDERDEPWSIGWTSKYPVDSSFLPNLVIIAEEFRKVGLELTIRQAIWCDRLKEMPDNKDWLNLVEENSPIRGPAADAHASLMSNVAIMYSEWERVCGLRHIDPNTGELFDARYLEDIWTKMKPYLGPREKDGDK